MLELLNSIQPLSADLRECLCYNIERQTIKKNVYLQKPGQIPNRIHFIESGLIICYHNSGKRNITSAFRREGDLLISSEGLYSRTEAHEYHKTLEDSILDSLSYNLLQMICKDFPEFNTHLRVLMERNARLNEELLYLLRTERAQGRYKWLTEKFPDLLEKVPCEQMASYIGITRGLLYTIKTRNERL
jgi:signal-transduction protein with cAMP-binding, CBS, and nucleotidyltransferase domain